MSHQETGKRKRSADGSDSADALRATQGHQYNSSRVFGGTAQFGDNRYGDNNSVIVVQKVTGSSPDRDSFAKASSKRSFEQHRNTFFCGRDDILHHIYRTLKPQRDGDLQQKMIMLYGIGGIGKTQIASQYVHCHGQDYSNIFWLPSEKGPELAEKYSSIADDVVSGSRLSDDQQRKIKKVKAWLSETSDPWLLIFDNVVTRDDIKNYIPNSSAGSIILTTQRRLNFSCQDIRVDGLSQDAGSQLLLSMVKSSERNTEVACNISRLVGGHPLALAQLGGYARESCLSLAELLDAYRAKEDWYDNPGMTDLFYEKTLRNVFDIVLKELKPNSRILLEWIALLGPEDICEDVLHLSEDPQWQYWPDPQSDRRIQSLRGNLVQRCLVNRDASQRLSIHRSLRDNLIHRLDGEGKDSELERRFWQAFSLIRSVTPQQSPRTQPTYRFEEYQTRLPQILALHSIYKGGPEHDRRCELQPNLKFAELLSDIGNYMWERNHLTYAFSVLDTAEEICNEVHGADEPEPIRTQILYLKASFELDHGCTMRAKGLERKKHILRLRQLKADSTTSEDAETDQLQLSTALNNLGCAYIQCEDYESAAPYLENALKIKQSWGTEQSAKTASGIAEQYKNLALVAISRGRREEALQFANNSVRVFSNWKGSESEGALFHRFMRASVMFNAGDVAAAYEESHEVLEIKKRVLDQSGRDVFDSHYALGLILHFQKELAKAESHLKECLKHRELNYETSVARVIYRLSLVMKDQGRFEEAEKYLSEARSLKEHLLSEGSCGVTMDDDEAVVFDQMVTCWAGRFGGKQNI